MLKSILVVLRRSRPIGAPVHSASLLASNRGRSTWLTAPRFGSAARALRHRFGVALMGTGFAHERERGCLTFFLLRAKGAVVLSSDCEMVFSLDVC